MASPKSPFLVYREFLSPKLCEQIIYNLNIYSPDVDKEGKPLRVLRTHEKSEELIFDRFQTTMPLMQDHYKYDHQGTELVSFEYYAEGVESKHQCENSVWTKAKKWARVRNRDFTCLLFLNTYQDQVPFDNDFEVYGGKLEFPQHNFGFNPERGTLIVFPSGPHFINVVAPVIAGELYVARWHVAALSPYLYQPVNFPGDYRSWFKDL
jgi:hypothetical protein